MKTDIMKTIWTGMLALIPTGILIWTDEMSLAFVVLLLAIILDSSSGMIKAWWCGTFESKIAWRKIPIKLIRFTIVVCACYLLEVIGESGEPLFAFLKGIFCWFMLGLSVLEVISVFENLEDMGLKIPFNIVKHIRRNVLKEDCEHKKK